MVSFGGAWSMCMNLEDKNKQFQSIYRLVLGCDSGLWGHVTILFYYWQPTGRWFWKTIAHPYGEKERGGRKEEEVPPRSLWED